MNHRILVFAFILILNAVPVSAFELRNPERDQRRLHIELEAAPARVQQDFDKYIQELAAAAQRDARAPATRKDIEKEQQAKTLNPIVLFRW